MLGNGYWLVKDMQVHLLHGTNIFILRAPLKLYGLHLHLFKSKKHFKDKITIPF